MRPCQKKKNQNWGADLLAAVSSKWLDGFRKWYDAGPNRLGLIQGDRIYKTGGVKEALRRLPEDLYNNNISN